MAPFRKKKPDDELVDMQARAPETGLKYKDIALMGQMLKDGADLAKPRLVSYYLYFSSSEAAEAAAGDATDRGYASSVRAPLPEYPGQWCLVCEKQDAILSIDYVRDADDLFQGLADRGAGEFDGWEAAT